MARKPSRKRVIYFDAQVLLGEKTGIGYFCYTLIEQIAKAMPNVQFVGSYHNFLRRENPILPRATNIRYVQNVVLPIQSVNLLRRFHVEIPIELRIFRRATAAMYLNYLSAPSLLKVPGIGFIYDLSFTDHPEFVSVKNQRDLERFVPVTLRRSAHIVTISEFTKDRLKKCFPGVHTDISVITIPPATSTRTVISLPNRLSEMGVVAKKYLLYVGTIEPRKNIANLVHAYTLLPQAIREEYALVLAGGKGWNDEATVSTIVTAQADGHQIIRTGYVSQDEKLALYQHATCFVLPSHYEGFGMPIFEAMQQNIPVAISDIPVFHEVAGDAVIYFNQSDPRDMAKTLTKLLADDMLRQALVKKGQKRLTGFSWSTNVHILQQLLNSTLRSQ